MRLAMTYPRAAESKPFSYQEKVMPIYAVDPDALPRVPLVATYLPGDFARGQRTRPPRLFVGTFAS